MTYRVLLSGGGTAGSVTPLIALAGELRRQLRDVEVLFVGTATGPERVLVTAAGIPFETISGGKLRRYWSWRNISDLIHIGRGYRQARALLRRWKPNLVISAGSFISVPMVWAAHRQGVATLIHQQDARPGLANRLMAPAADRVTVAFTTTSPHFPASKVRWVGNPVRPEILQGSSEQGREIFGLSVHRPVVLVMGGGTGSAALNDIIESLASTLVARWSVLHVVGSDRQPTSFRHPEYHQFPFLTDQLPHALAVADVVVSRAGLGAMTELAALSKPVIFIPMPHTHQEDNAAIIAAAEAGVVLSQNDELPTALMVQLQRLLDHPAERRTLGEQLRRLYNPQALPLMAQEAIDLMRA